MNRRNKAYDYMVERKEEVHNIDGLLYERISNFVQWRINDDLGPFN